MHYMKFEKVPDQLANKLLADLAAKLRLPKAEVAKIAIAEMWAGVVGQ